jgi:hypothetical protein
MSSTAGRLAATMKITDMRWCGVCGSLMGVEVVGLAKNLLGDLRGWHSEVGVKVVHDASLSLPKCSLSGHAHQHEDAKEVLVEHHRAVRHEA